MSIKKKGKINLSEADLQKLHKIVNIKHPNVARFFGIYSERFNNYRYFCAYEIYTDFKLYRVMQYSNRGSLRHLLQSNYYKLGFPNTPILRGDNFLLNSNGIGCPLRKPPPSESWTYSRDQSVSFTGYMQWASENWRSVGLSWRYQCIQLFFRWQLPGQGQWTLFI